MRKVYKIGHYFVSFLYRLFACIFSTFHFVVISLFRGEKLLIFVLLSFRLEIIANQPPYKMTQISHHIEDIFRFEQSS